MNSPFRSAAVLLTATLALVGIRPPALTAQSTGTIQGEVQEAGSLRPLSTIQVYLPEIGRGTLTNSSGRFQLVNVPAGQVQISAQGVGYATETRTVTVTPGQTVTVDFMLNPSAIALDEVVVTGAGQATAVKKLGNTVATIDTRALETAPVSNVSEVLQGREPGVVALPTGGVAGEGTKIRIRGGASLSQSNEPIIIVDGIRVDNGGGMGGLEQGGGSPSRLDDINPASIERIEILKGAAAATLYGTEASNGVIQIFTKDGIAGEPRWNLQIEQGVSHYPEDRYEPHSGFARTPEQAQAVNEFWGLNVQPYEVFTVDMWPKMFEAGRFGSYNLSVNGGNERVTYFVSGRLLSEDGPMQSDGFGAAQNGIEQVQDLNSKKQANANVTFYPWDNLQVRANSMYIDSYLEVADNNNNIYGTISNLINSKPERASERNPSGAVPTFGSMREMMNQRTMQDVQRFFGSIGAQYTPMESLGLDLTVGVDMVNEQNVIFVPFGWNVDGLSGATPTGSREVRDRNLRIFSLDTRASWNEQLTDAFSSAFVVGAQAYYNENKRSGGEGSEFSGPGLEVIEAGALQEVFEAYTAGVSAGVFVQEQVGYRDYLFATVGARYDQHSAFGESAGGVVYPKLSLSFVPSDMPGWSGMGPISSLRLRAAVGQSGLQPNAFDKFTTFEPLNSATGPGVEPSNLGNPDLKPEVSTEYEAGGDIGFFGDRMSLTATYWNRTVNDLMVSRQFPLSGGFTQTQLDNIGQMKAHGLELGLSGLVLNTPDYSLDLFVNGAFLSQEVTDMGGAPDIKLGYYRYGNWIKEGYSPGSFFGPKLLDVENPIDVNGDGQPDSREELLAFFDEPQQVETIRTLLADEDGDGDYLDHYLGKPTPDWSGALGGTLTFLQNFRIGTLFEYKTGFQWHNLTDEFRRSHGLIGRNIRESAELEAIINNPASTAEQRADAAVRWAREMNALSPQDRLNAIEDGDFVRWRELSLTYTVPGSLVERFGMNTMDLTLAGRNLMLWTGYTGVDPELNVVGGRGPGNVLENNYLTGVEGWGFAMPRRITLSVNVGF